jgi:hypothetical protein
MQTTLRDFSGTMRMPLRGGDTGVSQTIALMRNVIDDAVDDPKVNEQGIEILRFAGAGNFDKREKLQAIYDFISNGMLYVEDPVGPFGPKETIRNVRTLLKQMAGDCDDFTVLTAALAGTIGIATRAVTIASDPASPKDFNHIYPEGEVYPGMWISMDAARPGAAFGVAPPRYYRKRIWSLTDSSYQDVSGVRASSLNGYAILGQSDAAAQDISAVGQSVANVIAASKGSPYGSFQTPYTPVSAPAGYGAPGYPGGPAGASLSFAGGSAVWWIAGIAAVAWALSAARK